MECSFFAQVEQVSFKPGVNYQTDKGVMDGENGRMETVKWRVENEVIVKETWLRRDCCRMLR